MRSAVLCHASEDAGFASELASFLESNCPLIVSREEGLVGTGRDLVDAVEWALSAELVLTLLSPDSVPKTWPRDKWEPVLLDNPRELGTQVAFLLLRNCKFPELLRRHNFFDLSQDRLAGQRALKRWILEQDSPFENPLELPEPCPATATACDILPELERRLADRPGLEIDINPETALAFAHTYTDDFEGVFWLNCARRSRAGILGDTAQALGLRLSDAAEQNWRALRDFCAHRRCLFIFEHVDAADRELVAFEGKTSVIFSSPSPPPTPRPLEEVMALFASWTRNADVCLHALGDAQWHLNKLLVDGRESWTALISLGRAMVALLKHYDRLAEAYEVLELMANATRAKEDVLAVHRLEWEKSWILEHWGQPVSLPIRTSLSKQPAQLSLEFGAL